MSKATLAQRTELTPWTRGLSAQAECDVPECDWTVGPDRDRVVLYAARRHVAIDGHSPVSIYHTYVREVHPKEVN